jgi:hypothetical protein
MDGNIKLRLTDEQVNVLFAPENAIDQKYLTNI